MLGLGETTEEVIETLADLRSIGCDFLTLGQYLQPSPDDICRWFATCRPLSSTSWAGWQKAWGSRRCQRAVRPVELPRRPDGSQIPRTRSRAVTSHWPTTWPPSMM